MLFSLEVLPAGEGDALLLHWGDDRALAVIDGGPKRTYETTLRPRLDEIRRARGLDTLPIDLVMVSHVDNDHIVGVNKLFAELRRQADQGLAPDQRPFRVDRLWHNTFRDVLGGALDGYYAGGPLAALAAVPGAADDRAGLAEALAAAGLADDLAPEDALDLSLVLAGHGEGRDLRDDHAKLYEAGQVQRLNAPFHKNGQPSPVMRTDPPSVPTIKRLSLRVIGPSEAELARLKRDFDKFVAEKGLAAEAALAALQTKDNSPTNLSSIVCLAEHGGKRILLTGDARGDRILEGLTEAGLLADGRLEVDVLKVPHHGSARNLSPEFFEKVRARTYVISADGKHGNPDREALEWLIGSRPKTEAYELAFTYPLADIDEVRKAIHERRDTWDPDLHALENLIAARQADGHAFTCTFGARVIDLGDTPLG